MVGYLSLAPELDAFRQQFEGLASQGEELTLGLADDQFNWHPPSGGWSVAQCLDHLNATARAYLPKLDEGIADGIRRGLYGDGPFRYNLLSRLVIRSQEPPVRFKFKAPPAFMPLPSRRRNETVAAFRAYQVQYVDRLRQANGLDLSRARVKSPASYLISLPLGAGFALTVAHERRHLEQARRVIAHPAFPR